MLRYVTLHYCPGVYYLLLLYYIFRDISGNQTKSKIVADHMVIMKIHLLLWPMFSPNQLCSKCLGMTSPKIPWSIWGAPNRRKHFLCSDIKHKKIIQACKNIIHPSLFSVFAEIHSEGQRSLDGHHSGISASLSIRAVFQKTDIHIGVGVVVLLLLFFAKITQATHAKKTWFLWPALLIHIIVSDEAHLLDF